MRPSVNAGLLVWALCVTAFVAMGVGIPHVFVPNTTASATEMNENFNALKAAVDALESPNRPGTIMLFGRIDGVGSPPTFQLGAYTSSGAALPEITDLGVGNWAFALPGGVIFNPQDHLVVVTIGDWALSAFVRPTDTGDVQIVITNAAGFYVDTIFQIAVFNRGSQLY